MWLDDRRARESAPLPSARGSVADGSRVGWRRRIFSGAAAGSTMAGPVAKTCTLAIDVGGTFTDITFTYPATRALWVAKTPSTPGDLSTGFVTAVRKVLALAGRAPGDVLRVFHGTTTATNAILEGKTPPTALVTTAGFKYVLEIGRHAIPPHANLYGWPNPPPPTPPHRPFQ